jgi:hypothetical protein
MNGEEMRRIRMRLVLSEDAFASELGYTGKGKNRINLIRDFESGKKRIPLYIARLAWLIDIVLRANAPGTGIWQGDDGNITGWPDWPGYTREELDDEAEA